MAKKSTEDFIGYLKPDVIAEPLINQWYAWSYLISPATAARYLTQSQFKVMQSFVNAPEVHETTLKDPAMMGGPFIQHPASRVDEVRSLLKKTKKEQQRLIALSEAIDTLNAILKAHPPGKSLEPLYAKLPAALKGYVELVYDACDSASIRFIEGLLYRSEYYSDAGHSLMLRVADCDQRAFVMSTPRLPDNESLPLSIPFTDARLDQLFQMRYVPQSVKAIATLLNISADDRPFFHSLFTPHAPRRFQPYTGDGVRVRYFGHACVLIEINNLSVLVDPLISYEHPTGVERYSYLDLPDTIDYALITHNHQDHVMLETLLQLRHKIKHIVVPSSQKGSLLDPSLKLALQQIGFSNVINLDELDSISLPDGEITSIPVLGEHGDLNIAAKNAYWVKIKGRSILCAADSNNLDTALYAHIHHLLGDLDLLFLGMECEGAPYTWAYGPLLPEAVSRSQSQTRRLDGSNADRAHALVQQLNPQQVYIYAMGQEPWLTYITSINYEPDAAPIVESDRLVEMCKQDGKECDRLFGKEEITLSSKPLTRKTTSLIPIAAIAQPSDSHAQTNNQKAKARMSTPASTPLNTSTADELTHFLTQLQSLDIRLWLDKGTLRCNAPKGALTPDITAQLKRNKPAIIALLKGSATEVQSENNNITSSKSHSKPISEDWQQDVILPPEIRSNSDQTEESSPSHALNILLTGATGFLGAFLLCELIQQTNASIYCLVRTDSTDNPIVGLNKIKACLLNYGIWENSFEERIVPIAGDLAKPHLGLSPEEFQDLASCINVIYHNGAQVHHLSPYAKLRAPNVFGTREILKLAFQNKLKTLHYTSTLSVLPPTPLPGQTKIYEQSDLSRYPVPVGGYNRSKWVAEQLVAQARDRHLPVTIYRPGPLSGHSKTGAFNPNDFLYRLMQGYIQSSAAPQGELPLDMLPVDYASKAIVYLSQQPKALSKAFHLIHPQPASSDLLFTACQTAGYPIERVPYGIWHQKLQQIAQNDP
ncbi:thioester reductase domain-containing protein, partial [cf. Phormidesmis sp. LEGE 11477]|uniref:thioester reductase domain-containing protein n=1 Tax=cf. Phormidesmis sp. LEGE 11477 TaxID=1828680 RepID=UPI0019FFDC48